MNVLIVSQFVIPHPGGASTHIEDLTSCLKQNGHRVSLIHGGDVKGSMLQKLMYFFLFGGRNDNYRSIVVKAKIRRMGRIIRRFLENNRVDIIHAHDPIAGYATHLVLDEMGRSTPVIETIHGPLVYEARMFLGKEINQSRYLRLFWEVEQQAFLKAKHLIAVDSGQGRIAIEDFGIDSAKVSVIFNAVSCREIDAIVKEPSAIKVPKPYLLVPRRLVEKTGVRTAIESLAELDADTKVHLVIAGDGPLKIALKKLAESLGVDSKVIFLGSIPRQEVLRLAKGALAIIVPSIPASGVIEATSIAAIEAMACGTAVIASDIGGLSELIQNNQTGLLVPHSNPEALSAKITQLYKDVDFRRAISFQARQYVLENLDTSVWFDRIMQVYSKCIV